jgi:GDP-L-fucose synthase
MDKQAKIYVAGHRGMVGSAIVRRLQAAGYTNVLTRTHAELDLTNQTTNLYGPNDNYDLNNSHVLPALIRKAHEAKLRGDTTYVVWGSGRPMREFLYVDDMADACVFLMEREDIDDGLFNVGTGQDVTIRELAETVMQVVGFKGEIVFDASKPDGTPRKLLNVDRLRALGWQATTPLQQGIAKAYADFLTKELA